MLNDIEKRITEAMDDLMQKDVICDFVITCDNKEYPAFSVRRSDAYLACCKIAEENNENAQCYIYHKSDKTRAVKPVFEIKDNIPFLSGLKI